MARSLNTNYRKVAIENSYYVEDLPDGTKNIIYQPCIYICSTNVKDLTLIEFDKPGDATTDNASNASSKDNNNSSNSLAPVEPTLMDAESAAAIANTLPEIIKNIEQEEVIKSATDPLSNGNLQVKTVNVNQQTSGPENEILVINFNGLTNLQNLQMQTQTSNENQNLSEQNKENSANDSDVLSNDVSLETELDTSNDDASNSNKENSAANFDTSQCNILDLQKDFILTRSCKEFNKSIQRYCNKCQVVLPNVMDNNCSTCQSLVVFQCINCSQLFDTYVLAENHVKLECQIEPAFKCSHCSYHSNIKNNFKKHFKRHLNLPKRSKIRKSLQCKWCKHEYPNRVTLLKHQRYCAKETQCPHCLHKSTTPKALLFHIFTKHQEYIPENHKCSFCGVKYRQEASLNRHMAKVHKTTSHGIVYQCDHCDAHLSSKNVLRRHVQTQHASLL